MRVLVLGGDGYLGWPTAMRFSSRSHEVGIVDNLARRKCLVERDSDTLIPIMPIDTRIDAWRGITGRTIEFFAGDVNDWPFLQRVVQAFQPEVMLHFAEQPSAPYSMIDRDHAVQTQANNVLGTLNVLFAMHLYAPRCHLVKLGTMGEYGTPNIDIEEGFIEIHHNGRSDVLPFPKQAGSFYHLSKVHDSNNIMFACRAWGLRATDLNQGVVYGIETDETALDPALATRFDYDECFGTALNRFCVQAVIGHPLTIYGRGGQTRGFLNIRDTLQCIELVVASPAASGEYRVFNQFTETFSVAELAELVRAAAHAIGLAVQIRSVPDPRVEKEEHYYNPRNSALLGLGLRPHTLSDELVQTMLRRIAAHRERINAAVIDPTITWRGVPVALTP